MYRNQRINANKFWQQGDDVFKRFFPITMQQLLHGAPPNLNYANKSFSLAENSELLYKIYRGDTKLVRSLLEANQF